MLHNLLKYLKKRLVTDEKLSSHIYNIPFQLINISWSMGSSKPFGFLVSTHIYNIKNYREEPERRGENKEVIDLI